MGIEVKISGWSVPIGDPIPSEFVPGPKESRRTPSLSDKRAPRGLNHDRFTSQAARGRNTDRGLPAWYMASHSRPRIASPRGPQEDQAIQESHLLGVILPEGGRIEQSAETGRESGQPVLSVTGEGVIRIWNVRVSPEVLANDGLTRAIGSPQENPSSEIPPAFML